MLCLEHGEDEMFNSLIDKFDKELDLNEKDTMHGNTALHLACKTQNVKAVEKLY